MRLRRAWLPLAVSALLAACGPGFEFEKTPHVGLTEDVGLTLPD
ncbi:hypothetical protein [Archangium sp.]|nr:hypothetical protein [Archangium sp.]